MGGRFAYQIPLLLSHRPKVQKSSLKFWLRDVGHFSIGQMTPVPVRYYNISPPSPSLALPYIWFYIFMHIWFILWLRYNMQGSVPVVSHKFKSGLSVSKEMGLSAVSPCIAPISNSKVEHKPVHIRVKCKFLFPPELQLLHCNCLGECVHLWGWIGCYRS